MRPRRVILGQRLLKQKVMNFSPGIIANDASDDYASTHAV